MKAYQVVQYGQPLEQEKVQSPSATGAEVVVAVAACGLCHSDVHFHEGHLSLGGEAQVPRSMLGANLPLTLGHEIFGHIESFGPDAGLTNADVGRSVIVYPWIGCGHCEACLTGHDNACPTPQNLGVQRPGGHGEKVVVREKKFLIDADGIEPTIAGVYACSGLTAYGALAKIPDRDGWVGIIGLGGVGLMALAIAKGIGFSKVVALDIDEGKLSIAKEQYGANVVFNSREDGVSDAVKSATGGLAAVIDFVGSDATSALGIGLLNNRGTYVGVGLFGGGVHLPIALLSSRQLSIRGSYVGTPDELRALVDHVRAGTIKSIPVRSEPIENVNEGLSQLRAGLVEGRLVHVHAVD